MRSECGDIRHQQFQDDEFDAIVSIDAFEYFGTDVRFLPSLLRCLRPRGRVGMTTPALRPDPYERGIPQVVEEVVGWEAAGWHAPEWWATHWRLTGLVTDVRSRMQSGGREDWLRWSMALSEDHASPIQRMLRGLSDEQLGFAVVSATKL